MSYLWLDLRFVHYFNAHGWSSLMTSTPTARAPDIYYTAFIQYTIVNYI